MSARQSFLMFPAKPRSFAEARLASVHPLPFQKVPTIDERIAYARDVDVLTPRQEETLSVIDRAVEPPLRAYAKWFEEFLKYNETRAKAWRKSFPLDEYLDMEAEYRKVGEKNLQLQFRGPSGTGKSSGAQSHMKRTHPEFDPYNDTFFTAIEIQAALQKKEIKNGYGFCKDEEPKQGGLTSQSIDTTMENLENTVFRRKRIDSDWVYVEQRSHRVQALLTTDKEVYREQGKLSHVVFNLSVPYANSDDFLWAGVTAIEVLPQKFVDEYLKRKDDFVSAMQRSSGRGPLRDVTITSDDVMEWAKDNDVVKYVLQMYADKPDKAVSKLTRHISSAHSMNAVQAEEVAYKIVKQAGLLGSIR